VTLPPGTPQYHWRCRTVDSNLRTSSWNTFGGNSDGSVIPPVSAARDVGKDAGLPNIAITVPTTGASYTTAASPLSLSGSAGDALSGVASITWANNQGGSGNAAGLGPWSIGSIILAPYNAPFNVINHITVTVMDTAGNSNIAVLDVTYDTVAPGVTFTTPVSSLTGSGTITIGGGATDDAQVASVNWVNNRGGSGPATLSGPVNNRTWSTAVSLAPGDNIITVTATDGAGNSANTPRTLHYDNIPPVITITSPASGYTTISPTMDLQINGTASDTPPGGIFEVAWVNNRGGSGIASGTSPWNVPLGTIALAAGANIITFTARDLGNNSASVAMTINRDTQNPVTTITVPTGTGVYATGSSSVDLGGTATDDIAVNTVTWVNNQGGAGGATLSGPVNSRTWSITGIGLSSAAVNQITVTTTDSVGRLHNAIINVTYSTAVPNVLVANPSTTTSVTASASLPIDGSATAAVGRQINTVVVLNTTTGVSPTETYTSGVLSTPWSATVDLVIGSNTVTVTATDDVGNFTTVTLTIINDPYAPAVTITGPTGAATYASGSTSIALAGVASDNRGVTRVRLDNLTTLTNADAVLSGPVVSRDWTVASINLAPGVNDLLVTAFDEALNTSTDFLQVTVDQGVPTVTITGPTSAPTFHTITSPIDIGGTATDPGGIANVTYSWSDGSTQISGTAVGTDSWSVTGIALSPGTNVITVIARDAAGNTRSDSITVYYDQARPTVAITSPTSDPTLSTNAASISLGGTASDDIGIVSVTWQSVGLTTKTGVASGTSFWSVATIPLDPGSNVITVSATDGAAQTPVTPATLTVTYDPNAPSITIADPATNPYSTTATPFSMSGTSSDLIGVTEVTWANTATGGSGTALGTTSWFAQCPLTSGPNLINVTAKDAAGNTTTVSTTIIYDPAAPVVTITTPTTATSITTGFTPLLIAGTAADDVGVVGVTWSSDRGPGGIPAGTPDDWNFSADLLPGNNVITVRATDGVGRTGTSIITVVYDPSAPVVNILVPTVEPTFNTTLSTINLSGNANDNLSLQNVTWSNAATGATGNASGSGAWTINGIALNQGVNVITVSATDGVGNVGSSVLSVKYDATPPVLTVDPPVTPTSTRPITLTGTATDNLEVVTILWVSNRGPSGSATLAPSQITPSWIGTWSAAGVYLYQGANIITVTALDALGNSDVDVVTIDFTAETVAPTTFITTPNGTGSATSAVTPIPLAGTAQDNVGIVSVTWHNQTTRVKGVANTAGLNPVTWDATVPLTAGRNVIVITSTDDAGNTGTATIVVDFTPPADVSAPSVQIIGPTNLDSYTSALSPQPVTVTASDDVGISSVIWENEATGGDGVFTPAGGTNWDTAIGLAPGPNLITVTAYDPVGNIATDTITITFNPPPGDTNPPTITITSHSTGTTIEVSAAFLALLGTASDNGTLVTVVWSNPATGKSGTVEGLSPWNVDLVLAPGLNVITVAAFDAAGNRTTDRLFVNYTPPPPPPEHVLAGHCGTLGPEMLLPLAVLLLARRRASRGRRAGR
jgi:large repetitive protein